MKKTSLSQVPTILLHSSPSFRKWLRHVHFLRKLSAELQTMLPHVLWQHTQIVNWRNNELLLQTDSAAWATRLRFEAPKIIKKLSGISEYPPTRTIRVCVRPLDSSAPDKNLKKHRRPQLSAARAREIREFAQGLSSSPELRATLIRLATNADE